MSRLLALALLLLSFSAARGFFGVYPRLKVSAPTGPAGGDAGEPLYVTPLLDAGNVSLARRLARVPLTDTLHVESYSGFFTVNATLGANQFFWYFPPVSAAPDAPVVLWLQGGPGASSLYGLFAEHGPLRVRRGRLERRKYTWALNHHLLYIDNPVGSGFSFARDAKALVRNEVEVGRDLLVSLLQFYRLFPELRSNKFFVTGESYAGKYVPALAYTIHMRNPTLPTAARINLAGVAIGNGLTDPQNQLLYGDYLYQHGLLDSNQRDVFHKYENLTRGYIKAQQWEEAFNTFDSLLNGDLTQGGSIFYNMTGYKYYFNILRTHDSNSSDEFARLLSRNDVRRSVHVGALPFNDGRAVEEALKADVMKSVAPWVAKLLGHYRVLVYNGQLDIIVAYPLTENYLRQLQFPGAAEYIKASRTLWHVDGEVAGYVKRAGNLTEVLVRNAGHMVPADQPKWALDLITRFTHGKSLQ